MQLEEEAVKVALAQNLSRLADFYPYILEFDIFAAEQGRMGPVGRLKGKGKGRGRAKT